MTLFCKSSSKATLRNTINNSKYEIDANRYTMKGGITVQVGCKVVYRWGGNVGRLNKLKKHALMI